MHDMHECLDLMVPSLAPRCKRRVVHEPSKRLHGTVHTVRKGVLPRHEELPAPARETKNGHYLRCVQLDGPGRIANRSGHASPRHHLTTYVGTLMLMRVDDTPPANDDTHALLDGNLQCN